MTPLWPLVALVAVMVAGIGFGALWRRWRADTGPFVKCDGCDIDADGFGHTCTTLVGTRTAHRVAVVEDFAEGGIVGGMGNLGVYCAKHCPGSCSNPHCCLVRHLA